MKQKTPRNPATLYREAVQIERDAINEFIKAAALYREAGPIEGDAKKDPAVWILMVQAERYVKALATARRLCKAARMHTV